MMKHVMTIILLAGLSFSSFAQKGIEIGATVMPQLATMINADDYDAGPELDLTGSHFGMAFSFDLGYNFGPTAGLGVRFIYSSLGQSYEGSYASLPNDDFYESFVELVLAQEFIVESNVPFYSAETKLNYLKIPLLFRYNTDPERTGMFEMTVGPHVNILMGAEHHYLDVETIYDLGPIGVLETKDLYKSTTVGFSLGLGAGFNLVENLQLSTGVRLEYDFLDLEDKEFDILTLPVWSPDRRSSTSASLGFFVGLAYVISMD